MQFAVFINAFIDASGRGQAFFLWSKGQNNNNINNNKYKCNLCRREDLPFLAFFLFIITYMSEQLFPEYVAFTDGIGRCEELCGQKTCQCYTCRRDRGTTNVGAPKRKIQIRPVHVDEKYIVISLCLRRERYVQVEQ